MLSPGPRRGFSDNVAKLSASRSAQSLQMNSEYYANLKQSASLRLSITVRTECKSWRGVLRSNVRELGAREEAIQLIRWCHSDRPRLTAWAVHQIRCAVGDAARGRDVLHADRRAEADQT